MIKIRVTVHGFDCRTRQQNGNIVEIIETYLLFTRYVSATARNQITMDIERVDGIRRNNALDNYDTDHWTVCCYRWQNILCNVNNNCNNYGGLYCSCLLSRIITHHYNNIVHVCFIDIFYNRGLPRTTVTTIGNRR